MLKIGNRCYLNSLQSFGFTAKGLEEFMEKQRLFFHDRVEAAEYFPAPSMSKCFNHFVDVHKRFPTQMEFCDTFFLENHDSIEEIMKKNKKYHGIEFDVWGGLRFRAERTYPSLVRDIHFAVYLKEHGYDVFWNSTVDVDYKMDVVVTIDKQPYGLALFTDTKRGNSNRARKITESSVPNGFIEIALPIKLREEGYKVGDYFVYGKRQELKMLAKIKELKDIKEEAS